MKNGPLSRRERVRGRARERATGVPKRIECHWHKVFAGAILKWTARNHAGFVLVLLEATCMNIMEGAREG
jgi:hypothetical protein